MARGELFRAVPGAAFRRLRWAGLDHAKVVKPAYHVYNTEADEGLRPFDPRKRDRGGRNGPDQWRAGTGGATPGPASTSARRHRDVQG